MRHYEIVLLIHPDQGNQVSSMGERYRGIVKEAGGRIHRFEDWGRRPLAYSINKIQKAHYLLLNIEVDYVVIEELQSLFKFNDAVLRHVCVKQKRAITEPSPIMKGIDQSKVKIKESRGREKTKFSESPVLAATQSQTEHKDDKE